MPHFLTHYLEYTNADIFIVAAGFEPCLSSSHLDSGRVQTIRLPSYQFCDWTKAYFFEVFSSGLRTTYDYTIICDIDEMVMAYSLGSGFLTNSLEDALFAIPTQSVIRCYGLNVAQADDEAPLSINQPFFKQRTTIHPVTAMNKPSIFGDYHLVCGGQHFTDVACPVQPLEGQESPISSFMFLNLHLKHSCRDTRLSVNKRFQAVNMETDHLNSYYKLINDSEYTGYRHYLRLKDTQRVPLDSSRFMSFYSEWNKGLKTDGTSSIHSRFSAPQKAADFLVCMPRHDTRS